MNEEEDHLEDVALDAAWGKIEEYEAHNKAVMIDGLWDQWCRTGDLDFFKLYIKRGGNIDDQETRDLIVDLIIEKNPGGKMPLESIRFYNHVRMLVEVKGMRKTEAVNYVAEQEGISNGWDRLKSGKNLES